MLLVVKLAAAYSASAGGGPDESSQLSMASRHSSMLGGASSHEAADISGGYRAHLSAASHYGGQYSSVYGSAALSSTQVGASYIYVCACVCIVYNSSINKNCEYMFQGCLPFPAHLWLK